VNTIELPAASPLSFPRLVSNMRVIALTLDSRARVTYCNRFFLEITGWTHREVLGCDWFDRFIPPDADELAGVFADLLRDSPEAWHHENEILRKSGERSLVRWNNAVLRGPNDEIIGVATIGEDITEQRHLERELLDSAAEERLHLAAELHDGLGQSLYGASLFVAGLRSKLGKHSVSDSELAEVDAAVASAMDSCHRIAHGLSPLANVRGSLIQALHALTQCAVKGQPTVNLKISESAALRLDVTSLDHLYRIAQEALSNSIKHARAISVDISFEVTASRVTLSIVDDGIGMPPHALCTNRLGLRLMRYRAGVIRAKLSIEPASPHGTRITVECPQQLPI
jgi:PAS domain S-box-containing protein